MNDRSDNTCPHATPWCTHHQTEYTDQGHELDSCVAWGYRLDGRRSSSKSVPPVAALYLRKLRTELGTLNPVIGLSVFGSAPWGVQPEEARRLAAALLELADTVDNERTDSCPECGRKVFPGQLEKGQECIDCNLSRLPRLVVVREES